MATRELKSIKFPDLGDTYEVKVTEQVLNTSLQALSNEVDTKINNAKTELNDNIAEANLTKADAIVKTASGEIASFTDGGDDLPMKSLNVNIVPKQSGSGDPSPSNVRPISGYEGVNVTRCGFNIWDEEWQLGYINPSTGIYQARSDRICAKNYLAVKPNTAYYFKDPSPTYMTAVWYDENQARIRNNSPHNEVITSPSNARYLRFSIPSEYGTTYLNDICVNVSETSKNGTYEPYNGTSYPISLGQTVYGGVLDVVSGKLTIDKVGLTFNGSENWWTNANLDYFGLQGQPASAGDNDRTQLANWLIGAGSGYTTFGAYRAQTNGNLAIGNIVGTDRHWANVDEFKTYLQSHTLVLVYKIATPTEIQLTPTEVKTLLGNNNIFADSGSVEVEYRADTTLAYNELLSLIASLS